MGAQVGGCFLKRSYATCFPVLGTPVSGRRAKGGEEERKKILENKRRRSFHIHPTQKRQVTEERHKNFMPSVENSFLPTKKNFKWEE